ncbi:DUF1302 domain-containing protein [Pseudomonas sp. N040]|uniref:DUF1302 domain-containing protein n=1 Tax=Pseudomonas sp. N040 TaxID=2785325 RepID=UPI00280AB564|nr:DUF1302 domain-containing protein [Pseudomonas sp. N040]
MKPSFPLHLSALLLSAVCPPGMAGVPFNIGAVEAQLDTSLDYALLWSTQGPDADLIGANNGGRGLSTASDDARLNYASGDSISRQLSGISALELRYQDSGAYVRGRYWYDFALQDDHLPFRQIDNSGRQQGAKSSGGEWLEAFAYQRYALEQQPGEVRVGRQTLNWGEGLFISNALNELNPQQASAYRLPVTPLGEGFLPSNLLHLSQALNERWELEGFYQLSRAEDVAENCSTFFAQADYLAQGCDDNLAVLQTRQQVAGLYGQPALATLESLGVQWNVPDEGVLVQRAADQDAPASGQFGLALHYFAEPLDTHFGLYALHVHSRQAYLGIRAPDQATYTAAQGQGALAPLVVAGNSQYFMGYPQDLQTWGLSFSSLLRSGTLWAGELSYRPNAPLQLSTVDLLAAAQTPLDSSQSPLQLAPGQSLSGYRRKDISQLQSSLSQTFDQVLGAQHMTVQGEVALVRVGGLESRSQARYGRDPVYGPGSLPGNSCVMRNTNELNAAGAPLNNASRYCSGDGFITSTAWGYRTRATWEYQQVLPRLTLKPNLAWSQDVAGYGPDELLSEGAKATSIGLEAEYQNIYRASLTYSSFFGGDFNTRADRDFLLFSLGIDI